jgi:hypothetical protein
MFKVELIMKTEISSPTRNTERLTNNSISSTRTNGRVNQPRDNSTKTSVFMLKEISTLLPT